MSRFPLPSAVVVVRHHAHEFQFSPKRFQVVGLVYDLFVSGDGGGEDESGFLFVEFCFQLLDEFGEVGSVALGAFAAVGLPADGVVPVQVEAFEVVATEEAYGCDYEAASGGAVGDQTGEFVSVGVCPASES